MAQNLRDRGYSQSREYKPNRSEKENTPMTNKVQPTTVSTPYTEVKRADSKVHDAMNRLVSAYTNKFFGTKMPRINNLDYESDYLGTPDTRSERGYALRDYKNNRLGYVSNALDYDDNGVPSAVYEAAIDNGNPNRGNLDIALNTPYGKINGGFDQEVNYAGYQTLSTDPYGLHAYWADDRFETPLEVNAGRGASDLTGGDMYFVDTNYPFTEDRYNSFNTPLGNLSYFTSAQTPYNEGYGSIQYDPSYYAQALINLLNK